jgi:ribose/xylose/arabinose/galactoside ABC-type transport system permease subunit
MECVLLVTCIVLSFTAPHFLTVDNLLNILRTESLKGIIAFGMTMVIIAGEIDLSVASMAAFAGCLLAELTAHGMPIPLGIVITLLAGGLIGALTAMLRSQFRVPTFISTLALLTGLHGAALMLTGEVTITPFPDWFNNLGTARLLGIPSPAVVLLITFFAIQFLMNYTAFGRSVYALGGNAEATRLSGINIWRLRVLIMAITAMLAALAGIMLSSRMQSGNPSAAEGWELDVIAAVIVGGTSLFGGAGTVRGTFIGVIFIGVIVNGMTLLNVPNYGQFLVRGALILAAVLLSQVEQKQN